MRFLNYVLKTLIFIFLTVLTQVGGLIYLLSFSTHNYIDKRIKRKALRVATKFSVFLTLYLISTLAIVPIIAKPFGRVSMPIRQTDNLRPLNLLTCLLNRHYVRPELKETAIDVSRKMNEKYPGSIVNYLEANFPFFDGFPLIPHLSHNDGKKLDLAFMYLDKSGKQTKEAPSFIGYGINEEPRALEKDMPEYCSERGYWQYGFLSSIMPQGNKEDFTFDSNRTKYMVQLFASNPSIGKIFIEPHLKTRLKLTSEKVRFHGCQAVRHDDHLHVQLK